MGSLIYRCHQSNNKSINSIIVQQMEHVNIQKKTLKY